MRVLDLVNELYNKGYIIKGLEFMNHKKDLNEKYRKEIDLLQNNKYTKEEKDNLNEEVKKIRENKKVHVISIYKLYYKA